jgi:hypothetical protein
MPTAPTLYVVLDHTCHTLHDLRKQIAAAGHLNVMLDVDSLIAVAHLEAQRKLRSLDLRK